MTEIEYRQGEDFMKEKIIIESAKQLFIEKGYKETSMNDIVKASNSSKGNLYHHFKNKDALFLRILKEDNQLWSDEWHKEEQNYTTAKEKLFAFADYNAKKDAYDPLRVAAGEFYARMAVSKEIYDQVIEINDQYNRCFEDLLRLGHEQGEWTMEDPAEISFLAGAFFTGVEIYMSEESIEDRIKTYRKAASLILRSL